jgi:hypothetical protein
MPSAQNLTACATQLQHHRAELFSWYRSTRPPPVYVLRINACCCWCRRANVRTKLWSQQRSGRSNQTHPVSLRRECYKSPSFPRAIDLARRDGAEMKIADRSVSKNNPWCNCSFNPGGSDPIHLTHSTSFTAYPPLLLCSTIHCSTRGNLLSVARSTVPRDDFYFLRL